MAVVRKNYFTSLFMAELECGQFARRNTYVSPQLPSAITNRNPNGSEQSDELEKSRKACDARNLFAQGPSIEPLN